jgi:4-aminobutyrate aminotransferase / (S)-3-amino-2-methylpropionate transaminase
MLDYIPIFYRAPQSYRIFNTWMGDPGKLLLLEGVIDVIKKENLLAQVKRSGDRLLSGLKDLQKEFPAHISRARGRGTFLAVTCSSTKLRDDLVGRLKAKGKFLYSI